METNSIDFNYNNNDDVSKRIKIILVGDSNVGKSSLVQEFTKKSHEIDPISTVGTDLKLHEIRINGELIKLYIWDTAGTERFRNHMCPSYFRHAQGALIVYDVSCSKSFEELSTWVKMIEKYSGSRLVKVIIGNKTDLPCRAITKQLAEEYAKSINCPYLETSAKTGMNVQQSFITLIQTTINAGNMLLLYLDIIKQSQRTKNIVWPRYDQSVPENVYRATTCLRAGNEEHKITKPTTRQSVNRIYISLIDVYMHKT